MRCRKAIELAGEAWGEGHLAARVRRHLDGCPACRREAALIQGLLDEVAGTPLPEPGEDYWRSFSARVHRRIAGSGSPRGSRRLRLPAPRLVWMGAAAAALLLLTATALWRLGAGDLIGSDEERNLALLEAQVRAAMEQASAADLEEVDTLAVGALPGEAGSVAWEQEAGEAFLTPEEALDAAGDLAAALRAEGFPEWSGIDRLVEELGREEASRLMEEMNLEGPRMKPEGEGEAG